jgi:large subunit ribosomal protein L31
MKDKIHPSYGKTIVKCACGETFESGSVKDHLNPFFTGKQKLVDSGGRVDKFKKRNEGR